MSKITSKARMSSSLCYSSFMQIPFETVALSASQTSATVQTQIPTLLNMKIVGWTAVMTGSPAGTCSVQLVLGTGAAGSPAVPNYQGTVAGQYPEDAYVTAGQTLSAPSAITMSAGSVTKYYNASNLDSVWPSGSLITLRTVTNGSAAGNLHLHLIVVPVDQNPMSPEQYNKTFVPAANTI